MIATRPTDAVLEAMVDRVETELFADHRRSRQRTRRLRVLSVTAAGVLLLGAGISVTAAFAFPHPPTAPDIQVLQPNGQYATNPVGLTIQCLNGSGAGTFVFGPGTVPGEAAARANPASVCPEAPTAASVSGSVSTSAAVLVAKGATCGTDNINDTDQQITWHSIVAADGQVSITQAPSSGPPTADCPLVLLKVPAGPTVPLAVCAIDSKNAAVFARGDQSAVDFCNALGEEVWKG
jgi:hypothetical protein